MKERKAQFGALVLLVALGITSYVAFVSSYSNLTVSADEANRQLHLADFSVRVIGAPRSAADEIARVPGVAAVEGRLIVDTGLEVSADQQATARIIGVPDGRHPAVNDLLVEEGDYPVISLALSGDAAAPGLPEAVVNTKFAEDTGLATGDMITVLPKGEHIDVKVSGIGISADYIYPIRAKGDIPVTGQFAVVYMVQEDVERLIGNPGVYTEFSVLVADGADQENVIGGVNNILEPYQVEETLRQPDQPSNFALREEISQNRSLAYSMPLLILVIAVLTLSIALSRLVQSQRGQIGLAKALGYGNLKILFHYLVFALAIALGGSVLGFVLGQLFARFITQLYIDLLNLPFLESHVYGSVIFWSVLMSTGACVAAGLLPAWRSARMLPANAMRVDPNLIVSGGRIPWVERVLSPALPSSFSFRIPLRNIFRARNRSIYTIIGIVFALVLTISTWALFDSFDSLIERKFNYEENWDVAASFSQPIGLAEGQDVQSWAGVTKLQAAGQIMGKLEFNGRTHEGALTAMDPAADFHRFDIVSGVSAADALNQDGLILPQTIADKLGVKVGDVIQVRTPYSTEGLPVKVRSIADEAWGAAMFTSAREGSALLGSPVTIPKANALYLNVEPENRSQVKRQLFELPGAESVFVKEDVKVSILDQLDFIYLFGGVLLAFGFSMAFVVIYNTFTANITERTREIATMRTIGEDGRHLALMVTMENMLLAVVGIPLGVVLGLYAANSLYASLSTEVYTFKAVLFPQTYVWIILSILGVLLVSEVPPILRIFRLDLAEATKVIE